jgi:hypothetical protein
MALTSLDPAHVPLRARLGQALRAMPGESLCGDQLGWWPHTDRLRLALADGLGHGNEAHLAATAAMRELAGQATDALDAVFACCDQALMHTRGVALAVVDILPGEMAIQHAAVGNIRTLLVQYGQVKRLAGARGIVGAGFTGLRPERLSIHPGDWLILFSDGIRENAGLVESLLGARPSDQLAGQLIEQWAGERDDASLLLYRHA